MQIPVPPGIESRIIANAKKRCLPVEEYALTLLIKSLPDTVDVTNEASYDQWQLEDNLRQGYESWQKVRAHDLYRKYCEWCNENNSMPISVVVFSKLMARTNISKGRDGAGYYYWATCDSLEKENIEISESANWFQQPKQTAQVQPTQPVPQPEEKPYKNAKRHRRWLREQEAKKGLESDNKPL